MTILDLLNFVTGGSDFSSLPEYVQTFLKNAEPVRKALHASGKYDAFLDLVDAENGPEIDDAFLNSFLDKLKAL